MSDKKKKEPAPTVSWWNCQLGAHDKCKARHPRFKDSVNCICTCHQTALPVTPVQ